MVKTSGKILQGSNPHHPKKGSQIKVEPIKDIKDIKTIKKMISNNPLHYCIFILGINTNLRASDLCRIKAGQVKNIKSGDEIEIKERKSKKYRRITLNNQCVQAINKLLETRDYKDDEPLLTGQRGPINERTIHKYVKRWCNAINLKGNYGSHTLRKTWGYHQRVTFGRGIPELMQAFNHSSQKQTLDYLCVQPSEIKSLYENEL